MEKLDLSQLHKSYFSAKANPGMLDVGAASFLSIPGKGDPSGETFALAVQALYATAYTVKFICKSSKRDFVVSKLEGLWWYDEEKFGGLSVDEAPYKVPRSEWEYRLLIRMPDLVSSVMVEEAKASVVLKKQIPQAEGIELYPMEEGKCVQILHVGPFSGEPKTLRRLNDFMMANNLMKNGLHHEIYLSDFRKTPPEKLRTILREPVK